MEQWYEVQKTDLQVKLLHDEDIDYPNFPEVFKELNPFDKGVEGRTTSGYKQEDPESRGVQKSIESKGSQTQLNPNALELKCLSARSSTASSDSESEYILPEELIYIGYQLSLE